jgi:hypothetical protein
MRRSFVLSAALVVILLSCGQPKERGLPTSEVMKRAAERSGDLLSARFTTEATFQMEGGTFPLDGSLTLDGVLQDGGRTVQFRASFEAEVAPVGKEAQASHLTGDIDVVLAGQREVYVRVNTLETTPNQGLFQEDVLQSLLGTWWLLPSSEQQPIPAVPGGIVTPSPSLLKAQSQVVRVTEDDGIVTRDGRKVYHYVVSVDQSKLLDYLEEVARAQQESFDRRSVSAALKKLSADGEMWIDAETFFLTAASWTVHALAEPGGGSILSGSFSVSFSDHNSAPPVELPREARSLSPAALTGAGGSPVGVGDPLSADELTRLRRLMENPSILDVPTP